MLQPTKQAQMQLSGFIDNERGSTVMGMQADGMSQLLEKDGLLPPLCYLLLMPTLMHPQRTTYMCVAYGIRCLSTDVWFWGDKLWYSVETKMSGFGVTSSDTVRKPSEHLSSWCWVGPGLHTAPEL